MELYGLPEYEVTRSFLFALWGSSEYLIYIGLVMFCFAVSIVYINFRFRCDLWKKGRFARVHLGYKIIIKRIISLLFTTNTPAAKPYNYLVHFFVATSFVVYVVTGLCFLLNEFLFIPFFDLSFLKGYVYLVWTAATDLASLLMMVSIIINVYVRAALRPRYLKTQLLDIFFLITSFLFLTGLFLVEGVRIALLGMPQYEVWSFIGYNCAYLFKSLSIANLEIIYLSGWLYTLTMFIIVAIIFGTKRGAFSLYAMLNQVFQGSKSQPDGYFYSDYKSEIVKTSGFGNSEIIDFSFQDLSSCDACTGCGLCDEHCPAVIAELPLFPQKIVNSLNRALDKSFDDHNELVAKNYISKEELYSCYDCGVCSTVCPVDVNPHSIIVGLKRYFALEKGDVPIHLADLFRNIETFFSCNGSNKQKRGTLANGLSIARLAESPDFEYLLYVGCNYTFDQKKQGIVRSIAKLFIHAGIKIAILAEEELCCGDAALRAGNTVLFENCVKANRKIFNKYGVKKIITLCAHGFNVFKNEYPQVKCGELCDERLEVFHYTEIIHQLLKENRLNFKKSINKNITVHDSCFLGRFNELYIVHRAIVEAIPGVHLLEMNAHGKNATCCGASGALTFGKKRMAYKLGEFRAMDGYSSGAQIIATACPFCRDSIGEGVKDINQQNIEVRDIGELIALSIE